jgi:hypothetical protein
MDDARVKRETLTHPYLDLIDTSPSFSNYQFWYTASTYLDIEGLFYLLAIRNVSVSGLVGNIQEFKILNPFNVQRIFDPVTKKLIGYKEYRGGTVRDIPKEMIIPFINLNPFNEEPYALTDAVKDHQFTLKTAGDYTRQAIAGNINVPGIISTDAILEGEELENFRARVTSHKKGEPLFGGGSGAIDWKDMQTDLTKSALSDVNTISLNNIIAASGASKTMLGIEESGTTRDTSATQKDNFIELRAMPQLQFIIDALNQDYKNYYAGQYKLNEYRILIENPLASDVTAEGLETANRQTGYDLYNNLVNKGYNREIAARYALGDMTLEELGEPTNEPISILPTNPQDSSVGSVNQDLHDHETHLQAIESGLLQTTEASLQNTIINIDNRLLATVTTHVGQVKNDFGSQDDLIKNKDKKSLQNELEIALAAFYGIILPLYASTVTTKRLEQYGKSTVFKMNNEVKSFIKEVADKTSASHIDTLLNAMMTDAQKDALAGLNRDTIANNLLNKYGGQITNSRAVAVARTETNRAFNMSQYQADKQFIDQNDLQGQMFKQWTCNSGNPCDFCLDMASEPPIPFDEPFASIGDELSTTTQNADGQDVVKKMSIDFMDSEAGDLHVNCACTYELVEG